MAEDILDPESTERPTIEPGPPIENRFLFVDVAALRAKQLRRGALPRVAGVEVGPAPIKPERVAMEEVRRGLVPYDLPAHQRAAVEAT